MMSSIFQITHKIIGDPVLKIGSIFLMYTFDANVLLESEEQKVLNNVYESIVGKKMT